MTINKPTHPWKKSTSEKKAAEDRSRIAATIDIEDLADLIHWARRYCDGRSTSEALSFNECYERITRDCDVGTKDKYDNTLIHKSTFWPYAQNAMYNSNTGMFNAMPKVDRRPSRSKKDVDDE